MLLMWSLLAISVDLIYHFDYKYIYMLYLQPGGTVIL